MTLGQVRPGSRVRVCGREAVVDYVSDVRVRLKYATRRRIETSDGESVEFDAAQYADVSPGAECEVLDV